MDNNEYGQAAKVMASFGAVGLIIGVGQLLASREKLTMRIIVGRALSSAGLGAISPAVLVFMPNLPLVAQFGIAALFASLGTSFIEKSFQKWIGTK